MLWVRSFEHQKHILKLMGQKMLAILHSKNCLSKPMIFPFKNKKKTNFKIHFVRPV